MHMHHAVAEPNDNSLSHVSCGSAATLLQSLASAAKENTGLAVRLYVRPKNEDGKAQIMELLDGVRASADAENAMLGVISKVGQFGDRVQLQDQTREQGSRHRNRRTWVGPAVHDRDH